MVQPRLCRSARRSSLLWMRIRSKSSAERPGNVRTVSNLNESFDPPAFYPDPGIRECSTVDPIPDLRIHSARGDVCGSASRHKGTTALCELFQLSFVPDRNASTHQANRGELGSASSHPTRLLSGMSSRARGLPAGLPLHCWRVLLSFFPLAS